MALVQLKIIDRLEPYSGTLCIRVMVKLFIIGDHLRDANRVNIEHVFPMSWVTRALSCGTRQQCRNTSKMFNRIEADMHNLFPALSEVNSARSSFSFTKIGGEYSAF